MLRFFVLFFVLPNLVGLLITYFVFLVRLLAQPNWSKMTGLEVAQFFFICVVTAGYYCVNWWWGIFKKFFIAIKASTASPAAK